MQTMSNSVAGDQANLMYIFEQRLDKLLGSITAGFDLTFGHAGKLMSQY